MKFVDEFREPETCRRLVDEIRRATTRQWTLMEVCGGQTHGLLRHGIDDELRGHVELVHGPGCPVCVTPVGAVDLAVELAGRPGMLVASFGDMLRVPGSRESLMSARSRGGTVRVVYSPLDALRLAEENPKVEVVFLAVGFETTVPATALAVRRARAVGLSNFSLLVSHVRVLPAMEWIAASPDSRIEAFLAAGHVCTVTGFEAYEAFARRHGLPVVVTGFEPVDLLAGILSCVRQLELGSANVENRYGRSVRPDGNPSARALVDEVYEVCDRPWRGVGTVPAGGFRLRPTWAEFDAESRFGRVAGPAEEHPSCRSADVLAGRVKPTECEAFGRECTPATPLGAPMVSAEGACAAYERYRRSTATAGDEQ